MDRTRTTNIKVRDQYQFIRRIGWGKKYYSLLLCISDDYNKFFPIKLPYIASVTHDECCVGEIAFKNEDSSVIFTYPRFQSTEYTFDSITEERFELSHGLKNLLHKKFINEFGFNVYTSYSGPEPQPEDIKFPYKPAFEQLTIQFNHAYRQMRMYRYVDTCMDVWQELSEIFTDGKPFRFADLINIVLNNFSIPIEELKMFEISGILKFAGGKIHTATSYTTEPEQLVKISKGTESFLSPMCNHYCEKVSIHQTFVSPEFSLDRINSAKKNCEKFNMTDKRLNDGERNSLYTKAQTQLIAFEKEIQSFESNCSIQGSKPSGS